ncbi:restriction endonuclease subunit S [Mariprofundus erugo]|uniref:Restriction endonuclease subunit S n=1 Tax=Mariprofundus erugo TaxID=2528639 RepID=A0A5R9GH03_9PROT|nr:restriction endonuclease subunit S [Mariprofundus erugo]TLS66141.1 restriction endonuclease subunit S [Mariprofundus erugo]
MGYKYQLPNGWIVATAQDYCTKVADGTHDSPKRIEDGKPLVTSKHIVGGRLDLSNAYHISIEDFDEVNRRSKVDRYDVLLSMIGTVGQPCLIEDEPDFAIKNVGLLKNNNPYKAKWLYFYLSSPQAQVQIKERLRGTTQQYLSLGEIRKFPVPYPENEDELKQLVDCLSSLHDKIELNRQINRTLEEMAQAIFKSWFVDFDPVKAKMIIREKGGSEKAQAFAAQAFIAGNVTLEALESMEAGYSGWEEMLHPLVVKNFEPMGLDQWEPEQLAATAALFPSTLTGSPLGPIPEGWEIKSIASWGKVVCGKTPSKKHEEYYGGNIPFIKIPDMHGNMFVTKSTDSLTKAGGQTQFNKRLPKGAVCVSCIATVGQVVITHEESFTNQQINSIVPEHSSATPYLYFLMLEKRDFLHDLASGGSATLNLNTGNFSKIEIISPDEALLEAYSECVSPFIDKILGNLKENECLSEMRDGLLPKLLSGEISVDAAEAELEEAA